MNILSLDNYGESVYGSIVVDNGIITLSDECFSIEELKLSDFQFLKCLIGSNTLSFEDFLPEVEYKGDKIYLTLFDENHKHSIFNKTYCVKVLLAKK